MAKLKLKNLIRNPLIEYMKNRDLAFASRGRMADNGQVVEKIKINATSPDDVNELLAIANNYGSHLYHDTTIINNMHLKNRFRYSSNAFENVTSNNSEVELPNYYIENINEHNTGTEDLKALETDVITREYLEQIGTKQNSLLSRTAQQLLKFRNIVFGNEYAPERSLATLEEYPYYNTLELASNKNEALMSGLLKSLTFQEEILGGLLSYEQSVNVDFLANEEDASVSVKNVLGLLANASLSLDISDKIILGTVKDNSNFMVNDFKRRLIQDALYNDIDGTLLSFKEMHNNAEVPRETLVYKIDKFVDNDTQPIQSFWIFDGKPYHDYQIKRDKIYRYKMSCYCLLYGTETRVSEAKEVQGGVEVTMISIPSYMYTTLDFDEVTTKVSPKIPLPPHVHFSNENNADNFIKIYLSLKYGSMKAKYMPITETDFATLDGINPEDDLYDFGYEMQDGKFEVYRLSEKPKTYDDFENAKIIDVRNSISTTDVIYRQDMRPNKKYYFMFRSVSLVGVASNPSPVYQVELIKMASSSKVAVEAITLDKTRHHTDKTFKSLLQIKPAFQQDIFDDQDEMVQELSTFKKKINDLTLGTATDKVWGKKFKIRVKSKDTGKIIDLNVKFNLIKDNIK